MASSKLIGTAPDQVPTNADLGELAFQNKDSVEFTGGKGGLSSLDLTAIAASKNVSATDIFVYDTSKDSDGGAWRNRCQTLSWYNETLNTATRGSRREFPSVAVIVLLNDTLHIYDGDSPDLPLWMTFVGHNNYSTAWAESPLGAYSRPYNAVAMLNGKLVVGMTSTVYYANNMTAIDFLMDDMRGYKYLGRYGRPISDRNIPSTGITQWADYGSAPYQLILGYTVNDVAMTVLPNAPIDSATGLPIPTIAVATNGGVSVIHNTGNVVNITPDVIQHHVSRNIKFIGNQLFFTDGNNYDSEDWTYQIGDIPQSSITNTHYSLMSGFRKYTSRMSNYNSSYGAYMQIPIWPEAPRTRVYIEQANGSLVYGGNGDAVNGGFVVMAENTQSPAKGMYSWIGKNYNTGYQVGDTKGAWLSDTTQETVVGAELTINGDMSSSTGWSTNAAGGGGSFTFDGQLTITQGASSVWMFAGQSFATVPGKTYTVSFQIITASSSPNWNIGIGTVFQSTNIAQYGYYYGNYLTAGTHTFQFTAVSSTTWFTIMQGGGATVAGVIDNVSIRAGDADRSVNNKGLQVYGSTTKTPVATGADLVAYSGFSTSNYLYQPYNSALDFGTGDFCYMGWMKTTNNGDTQGIFSRQQTGQTSGNRLQFQINNLGKFELYNATNVGTLTGNYVCNDGVWHQVALLRRVGIFSLYVDGVYQSSFTDTANYSNTAPLGFGILVYGMQYPLTNGSLALWRATATAPSDDQIKKIYNDEKVLFQDNAKATLYGTSDAVTALAYDQDTKLLHVGTSSGRSVFQGLRRVDNTTTAVSTSISAANGLVAEN